VEVRYGVLTLCETSQKRDRQSERAMKGRQVSGGIGFARSRRLAPVRCAGTAIGGAGRPIPTWCGVVELSRRIGRAARGTGRSDRSAPASLW